MAIYREKVFALAAKMQTAEGTDSVPALGTDALRVVGIPSIQVRDAEPGLRDDVVHGGLGVLGRAAAKGRTASLEVTVELFGKGSAYSASGDVFHADVLLRGAGLSRTFSTNKLIYTTLDSGMETFSLYAYTADGMLIKLVDCVAKPKLLLTPGKPGLLACTVEGVVTSIAAGSISGLVLPTVLPPVWADTTVSVGAWSAATASPNQLSPRKLEIDFGTATEERPWAGANAHRGFAVSDRLVRASMDVEPVALATFDPFARSAEAQGSSAVDTKITTQLNGGAGNTIDIKTGQWQLDAPGKASFGGLAGWSLAGGIIARSITSGDGNGRELAITVS